MNYHPIEATPGEVTIQVWVVRGGLGIIVGNHRLLGHLVGYRESCGHMEHESTNKRWPVNIHLVLLLGFKAAEGLYRGWLKCWLVGEESTRLQQARPLWHLGLHDGVVVKRNVKELLWRQSTRARYRDGKIGHV